MKNKTVDIILITLIIITFITYFSIRDADLEDSKLNEKFNLIESYALKNNWKETLKVSEEVKKEWFDHKFITMLNFAEEDFSTFEITLNEIVGGAKSKDLPTVLTKVAIAKDLWVNINKIVPQP